MSIFHYVAFHRDTYKTSVAYARNLMVLDKESIISAAAQIGLKLSKSHTKERLANELSEYVRMHANVALAYVNDEQMMLLKELVDAGPDTIVWKRHLRKYDFLKQMVWVVVNYDRQGKKDGFVLVDELREAFAPVIEERIGDVQKRMADQKSTDKQKRIALKDVHKMLDGMDMELAEKVHLLFMTNYIDYGDYAFRDEWQVDNYCWCYRDLFEQRTREALEIANSFVVDFLDEWRKDAPSHYRKAKDDLCYWINDDWFGFESPMQKEIVSAYQGALKKGNGTAIALALSPFAMKTAEMVKGGAYEEAAGCCYTIFRCLAKACKKHEDWFSGFTGYGDTYTKLSIFTEAIAELYCHLRQQPNLSKYMADEMDINLEVLNLETDFFGDLHSSSRFTDMLCDGKVQYHNYSVLEMCPMWGMWMKDDV